MQKKYLRMIERMADSGPLEWSVYMLCCGDGSLYTGIAKNVELRLVSHQKGRGAAYTRTHLPVALVYKEVALTRSQALIREAAIKRLPRLKKEDLIKIKGDSHDPSSRQPHPRRRRSHRQRPQVQN